MESAILALRVSRVRVHRVTLSGKLEPALASSVGMPVTLSCWNRTMPPLSVTTATSVEFHMPASLSMPSSSPTESSISTIIEQNLSSTRHHEGSAEHRAQRVGDAKARVRTVGALPPPPVVCHRAARLHRSRLERVVHGLVRHVQEQPLALVALQPLGEAADQLGGGVHVVVQAVCARCLAERHARR